MSLLLIFTSSIFQLSVLLSPCPRDDHIYCNLLTKSVWSNVKVVTHSNDSQVSEMEAGGGY